ncbi:MAG: pilus assembly protein TadE [Arthrobacter sp.]|jgi:Flp pilus assembly protein TadG|nr:pilus assembly protein TadE [Arthrobacter sp.]MCU1553174.1 pilus assembly protein TadE [Arthrobacter sp.]
MTRERPGTAAAPGRPFPPQRRASRGAGSPPADGRLQPRPGAAGGSGHGAITAEFAVALPAVILLLAMVLAGSAAGVTQLRFEEAARAGARALARGDSPAAIDGIVRRLAGEASGTAVTSEGDWSSVTVSGRVQGAVGSLVPWTLSARAWARRESARAAAPVRVVPVRIHHPVGLGW